MLHPIGFSIPSEKIVSNMPPKNKILAFLIPKKRLENRDTYIYETEEDYYQDYRDSVFALTKKKAGWDCLRHYEILAQGCIPLFENLENCPENTLTFLPKEKILEAKKYCDMLKSSKEEFGTPTILQKKYHEIAEELLAYTRNYLTTEKMADHILNISYHKNVKKILFLSGGKRFGMVPNYMRDLLLHGFKKKFGAECHDFPQVPHIYTDFENEKKLYGKGFTYTKNVLAEHRDPTKDSRVQKDIESHEYDIIIYGSVHDGTPLWDLVKNNYDPNDIILICGDDIHSPCAFQTFVKQGHHVFVREL